MGARAQNDGGKNKLLDRALAVNPYCARAAALLAEQKIANGDSEAALALLRRIEIRAPALLWLAVAPLAKALAAAGRESELRPTITRWLREHPSAPLFEAAAAALAGDSSPADFALEALPHVKGLAAAESYLAARAGDDSGLETLREAVARARRRRVFGCGRCGYEAESFVWECPGCHEWETMRPLE